MDDPPCPTKPRCIISQSQGGFHGSGALQLEDRAAVVKAALARSSNSADLRIGGLMSYVEHGAAAAPALLIAASRGRTVDVPPLQDEISPRTLIAGELAP